MSKLLDGQPKSKQFCFLFLNAIELEQVAAILTPAGVNCTTFYQKGTVNEES